MSKSAAFVTCPRCDRIMLGQRIGDTEYPQPHDCPGQTKQAGGDVVPWEAFDETHPDYVPLAAPKGLEPDGAQTTEPTAD